MFGSPETTTGGKALKFYASIRMDIRRIAAIKDGTEVIGNRTKVKIVKQLQEFSFLCSNLQLILKYKDDTPISFKSSW